MTCLIFSEERSHNGLKNNWWKTVAATVTGSMHERRGDLGQDAFAIGVSDSLIVVALCDGAGSSRHGLEGARICSQSVVSGLTKDLLLLKSSKNRISKDDIVLYIVSRV